ncbi:MAG: phosphatase PAP2 family protein [Desulfuromonadaceae bacterium]|nr:phosphatase PAP2 family protein [Desulfuromonadaceae bacterium]
MSQTQQNDFSYFCKSIILCSVITILHAATTALPAYALELQPESPTFTAVQTAQPDKINGEYIRGYFSDTGKLLVSPIDWDRSDWLKAGLVVGATAGLFLVDEPVRDFIKKNQSSTGDALASAGNALGDPLYVVPPLGLLYLYGHLYDDSKARRASLLATESLVISGTFAWALKTATQCHRPFTNEPPNFWYKPKANEMLNTSFPSAHTTAAFSIASVLSEEYGTNPLVPPLAYGLASLTGLSRMYDNKHWASDVFFGAALGYFVGKTVVRYHTVERQSAVMILPTISQQGIRLTAAYRF